MSARRLAAAFTLASAALLLAGGAVDDARADQAPAPPVIAGVTPQSVTAGTTVRVTVSGSGLSGAAAVVLDPPISGDSFQAFNDTTLLLSLPATTPAGQYALRVITPQGAAQSPMEFTVLAAPRSPQASSAAEPAVPEPAVSLAPAPVAADPSQAPAAAESVPATSARTARPATLDAAASAPGQNPFLVFAIGIAVGSFLYALWGKEGRLRVARRRGFFAQLWARPLQRLRVARICLHCGRLHYIVRTRRDLWKAGDFCSATCFVAEQEDVRELASSEGVAPSRLRGVGVYTDMEETLQSVLRAEASAHRATLFGVAAAPNPALVPQPAALEDADGEPVMVVAPSPEVRLTA